MSATSTSGRIHPLSAIDKSALPPDGGPNYNRLIFEQSPYLLQHAANPVDWHPWGEAAFALARERDLPVFLSIGYATCHWCHVMAHESFEDAEVAARLDRDFVAIKVDREERPDIDQVYMHACQIMTGSGGWPLTLVLTPDRRPFFAATYIPKHPHSGSYGLLQLLEHIGRLWREDRARIDQAGSEMVRALGQLTAESGQLATLDTLPLRQALEHFRTSFDPVHGGFGGAPKFPTAHQLQLLLRLDQRFAVPDATKMATATLHAIRRGGIIDQIGGGIHRYSVDERWLVPHFEKMLYDQALLVLSAIEGYQASGETGLATLARDVLDYMLRDLLDPGGAFCSGEDADSEGEEGTFYLWTPHQVEAVLGSSEGHEFCAAFDITAAGNFERRNIPHLSGDEDNSERWRDALERLRLARQQRPRPLLDDKVLTGWNGLAIAALARASAVLNEECYAGAAENAANFILQHLHDRDGQLLRRWRQGNAGISAYLEDYAALAWGLLELHQATLNPFWLEQSLRLTREMLVRFDDGNGGLFDSAAGDERLPVRPRSWQDGAIPAAASIAAGNLLRLALLGDDPALEERGRQLLGRQLAESRHYPGAAALLLCALDFALGPATVVTLEAIAPGQRALWLDPVRTAFHPRLLLQTADGKTPLARVCHGTTCLPPFSTPRDFAIWFGTLRTTNSNGPHPKG